MNNFEKEYYEAEEFWKDGMIEDADNLIRIEATIKMIPEGVTTLADIGCGNGIFARELAKLRPEIDSLSIDRSETALIFVKTPKMQGDITNLELKNNSFESVTCLQVLEHIPYTSYEKVISELARISSKYIIIGVPYNENIEAKVTKCPKCYSVFNIDLHLRKYNSTDINDLFIDFGFSCIQTENVVKKETYAGIEKYAKLRNLIWKKKEIFNSPLCPICGFINTDFKQNIPETIPELSKKSNDSFKGLIRKYWPKKIVDGYWIIALYERNI